MLCDTVYMLRLTEVKLPLDHPDGAIEGAILKKLKISAGELVGYSIFKRSYDARRRGAILLIYTLDVETRHEAHILKRFCDDRRAGAA